MPTPLPEALADWDAFAAARPDFAVRFADSANETAASAWPAAAWERLAETGALRWFLPVEYGGWGWSYPDLIRGYLALSRSCLTTTFVLTQWAAGVKRLLASERADLKAEHLPRWAAGDGFITVAISHLTTSRRHVARPILEAIPVPGGVRLDGYSPWSSGAAHASHLIVGGTQDDGRQVVALVPTATPGVTADPPLRLIALEAAATGGVRFDGVFVPESYILAGPVENALQQLSGGAGGWETSALAIGLAAAAIDYLRTEAARRPELLPATEGFAAEQDRLRTLLFRAVGGEAPCTANQLRTWANAHVLEATQGALVAAKGAGFDRRSPVGRWCTEALFFLVWSCPQPVAQATLCDLAGLATE